VNGWLVAAAVLMAGGMGATVWGVSGGGLSRRLRAQNAAGLVTALVLLLLSQGFSRPSYADLALMLAVLAPTGTLVYVRLLAEGGVGEGDSGRALTWVGAGLAVATVVPLCVVTPPGRALAKMIVIGALALAGWLVSSLAVSRG
jgi:multisubunit Na+/H+ antiporter MnhF subunit